MSLFERGNKGVSKLSDLSVIYGAVIGYYLHYLVKYPIRGYDAR